MEKSIRCFQLSPKTLTVKLVCFGCEKCEKSESAKLIPILGQVGEEALVGLPIKAQASCLSEGQTYWSNCRGSNFAE